MVLFNTRLNNYFEEHKEKYKQCKLENIKKLFSNFSRTISDTRNGLFHYKSKLFKLEKGNEMLELLIILDLLVRDLLLSKLEIKIDLKSLGENHSMIHDRKLDNNQYEKTYSYESEDRNGTEKMNKFISMSNSN